MEISEKKKYIIAIDGGSQSTKIVIFDTLGNLVCEVKNNLRPMHCPKPDIVEHPDDDLWTSLQESCKEIMQKFPYNKADLIGIGLCSIRFCRVLLKKDGSLASPVISWMDPRVSRPYEHSDPNVAYVTTSTGYLTQRLTGNFVDTASNYQGEWPIDTDTWNWSDAKNVFDHYQIPREMLFDLQMPGTILGHLTKEAALLTGMPEGLPVIATGNDKAVEALGAGVLQPNQAILSLGTYIAAMIPGENNIKDAVHSWTNFACHPKAYLYESAGIRRGMWTVSWWMDLLGEELTQKARLLGLSPEEYLNSLAESVPAGSDGLLTVMEFLAPVSAPYKRGIMLGFDVRHTAAHVYRSIIEGIALTMKRNIENLCEEHNSSIEQMIITGGGSNSSLFMQILSDAFGIPVMRSKINGAVSLGAAICVSVALGIYSDFAEAAKVMVKVSKRFEPNEKRHELYHRLDTEVYRHITEQTDVLLEKLSSII